MITDATSCRAQCEQPVPLLVGEKKVQRLSPRFLACFTSECMCVKKRWTSVYTCSASGSRDLIYTGPGLFTAPCASVLRLQNHLSLRISLWDLSLGASRHQGNIYPDSLLIGFFDTILFVYSIWLIFLVSKSIHSWLLLWFLRSGVRRESKRVHRHTWLFAGETHAQGLRTEIVSVPWS